MEHGFSVSSGDGFTGEVGLDEALKAETPEAIQALTSFGRNFLLQPCIRLKSLNYKKWFAIPFNSFV